MARLSFIMNQSLDGFVDHDRFAPDAELFRHFVAMVGGLSGSLYGRGLYTLMRYWDEDQAGWSPDERAFAAAWRRQPKFVVSRTLTGVGPNATLIRDDVGAAVRALKDSLTGTIEVGGPRLAASLAGMGLIDEWVVYLHPAVLGQGTPFFAAPPPPLRLAESGRIGADVMRLCYVPR